MPTIESDFFIKALHKASKFNHLYLINEGFLKIPALGLPFTKSTIEWYKLYPSIKNITLFIRIFPPKIKKPELLIEQLTPADVNDPGKVAQSYAGSILQLKQYCETLEFTLEHYQHIHDTYKNLELRFKMEEEQGETNEKVEWYY